MVYSTFSGNVLIRAMEVADIPWLMAFQETAVPFLGGKEIPWTEAQWRQHFEVFPEGQLVALLDEQIVGFAASLLLGAGSNPYRVHTFEGVTEGGWFLNHEAEGESLFVADIRVEPDGRGEEWAGALHEALRDLGHVRNCQRILAAVCLARFKETAKDPVAVDYGKKILAGEIKDPILFFHLRQGFVVRSLMPLYRPMSKNQGIMGLVEWVNPGHEVKTKSPVVRVASVPFKVQRIGSFEEFAGQVAYFVETAAGYESDFVVFPEFFSVPLLSMMDELPPAEGIRTLARNFTQRFIELLSGLAKQHGLYIIGGSHPVEEGGVLLNKCLVFDPDGSFVAQPKLHITPWETRSWGIVGGNELVVITTPKARIGVQICYDIEFPEATRYLAEEGVDILFVPYCTDDRQGYWRVRHCAQARAIENQIYIVTAGVTGHLSGVPEMNVHYGDAAVYCPSDFGFGRDGVHAITDPNVETMLVTDIDTGLLQRARANGSVTPRLDRRADLFECRTKVKMTGRNVRRD